MRCGKVDQINQGENFITWRVKGFSRKGIWIQGKGK